MPRPIKKNADYFTHDKDMRNDPKIKALRTKFGPAGYAVYCMMLETLTDSDEFRHSFLDIDKVLLAGDYGVEQELFDAIIEFSTSIIGVFDVDNGFITCPKLKERFFPLIEKRERQRKNIIDSDNTVIDSDNPVIKAETPVIDVGNTQSRVKQSIVYKSKQSITDTAKTEIIPAYTETDKIDKDILKFVKGFKNRFSASFSREDISALRNSVNKYWKDIEVEFYSLEIFLRTILMRMEDINAARVINNPISFFFAGAFGENRYLWERTAKEENSGPGYNKEMINAALASENGGVTAGLKAMV